MTYTSGRHWTRQVSMALTLTSSTNFLRATCETCQSRQPPEDGFGARLFLTS